MSAPENVEPENVGGAVAATRDELASAPPLRMPRDLAARLAEELDRIDREPARAADVVGARRRADADRPHRRRSLVPVAAAALVAIAVAVPVLQRLPWSGTGAPDLARAVTASLATPPSGPFTDPERLGACLAGVGAPPPGTVVGTRASTLNGRSGFLVVMTTSVAGRFRVVHAEPRCGLGPAGPGADVVLDVVVGG
ncbi:MAG: hypothetical protein OJJ54_12220 [Pseudonocardia sp.]|nr:hypothetical protein [Pseudonocardia sp.]